MGKRGSSSFEKEINEDTKKKQKQSASFGKKRKTKTEDVNKGMELDSQDVSPEALGYYDVFLNHRGPDVKRSFVSHLYKSLCDRGCNPFLDAKRLIKGKHALNSINEALCGVRVHLAIFSEGYAESKYCLNELVDMMKSPEKVIPIFFEGVEPVHLHWIKSGPFAKAFEKHLVKKRDEDVKRWTKALFEASHLTGFRRSEYSDECAFMEDIVARVLEAFGPAQLRPARYPVGLEQSSEVVLNILNQMGNTVGVVGLTGKGGIGKTTLATHLYNEQNNFTCRSFLKDVKDANMENLKEKMVWDLLQEDMKKIGGFERCFEQMKKKKIFVVLDDIVKRSQFDELIPDLNNLAGGSRVLITSRDQSVLNNIMRDAGEKLLHEVQELSASNSLQLFLKSAFHNDIPSRRLRDLSRDIAKECGGLPLALEITGGFLFDKRGDEALWHEAMEALHKNKEILDCLKLSYNSLGEVEQEMFLDIAFFLVGAPKDAALDFWNSDDFFSPAFTFLCKLIDRCLLKVDENGFLTMHDLLRDMGRDVVMKKSPRNEGEQSHLCNPSAVTKVLEQNKGTEKVRGLTTSGIQNRGNGIEAIWQAEHFASLNELRILILEDCDVKGDFSKWSRELRWLQWRHWNLIELPKDLQLPNLIMLDLAYSEHLCCIWPKDFEIQIPFPRLCTLNLEGCCKLLELPKSIGGLTKLRVLNISYSRVKELPEDFGRLQNLQDFNASDCSSLSRLPDSLGQLPNLETLDLEDCVGLQSLPTSVGGLTKLRVLNISNSRVKELPEDFGRLQSLVEFNAGACSSLSRLPESLGELPNLERLYLQHWDQLESLPTLFSGLMKLRVLNISYSGVQELPEDFGRLQSLVEFYATCCSSLSRLPESLGQLPNLETLYLGGCGHLQNLPTSIGGLTKLRVLNISYSRVQELSEDFGRLQSLVEFNASCCFCLSRLPESLDQLPNLETLELGGCGHLQSLPTSIGGLTKLRVLNISGSGVKELPEDFGRLQSLVEFNAWGCSTLPRLPESLGQLPNLETLDLGGCGHLQSLPTSIGGLTKLSVLNISGSGVQELPEDFGRLQSLVEFNARGCSCLSRLPESMGQLANLERLALGGCGHLQSLPTSIGGLTKLRVLNISGSGVQELPEDFGRLQSLVEFNARGSSCLSRLPESLGQLANLERLALECCGRLQSLPTSIGGLTKLRVLNISGSGVQELPEDFGRLQSLVEFNARRCSSWSRLPESLGQFANLERLDLQGCGSLQSLPTSIGGLTKLRVLNISYSGVQELPEDFGRLQSLVEFNVRGCSSWSRLPESLGQFANLERLDLQGCGRLQSLPTSTGGLTKLTVLNISGSGVQELPEDFGRLQSLVEFNGRRCSCLSRLPESLGQLANLERLALEGCGRLQSLPTSIGGLTKLRVLNISGSGVQELPEDFGRLQSLVEFNAKECSSLSRLPESLGQLPNLETLDLGGCGHLQSLPTSIGGLTKLRVLNISGSRVQELPENFGRLQSLVEFNASCCFCLSRLPESLGQLGNLERLDLQGCGRLQSLPTSIGGLTKLRVLNILGSRGKNFRRILGDYKVL